MIIQDHSLFVHIPKTGGSSISNVINSSLKCKKNKKHMKHYAVRDYIRHCGKVGFYNRFKFTVVRNPWDRLVSYFEHRRKYNLDKPTMSGLEHKLLKNKEFCPWFHQIVLRLDWLNKSTRIHYGPSNQTYMLINWKNKIAVENICRFENLEEDFRNIAENHLGIESYVFPHLLKTDRAPYQDYYNDSTRRAVGDFYRSDIKNFNYSF
jgi:hypothetical protein